MSIRRLYDVATSYRRLIDVETTSCVYWVKCGLKDLQFSGKLVLNEFYRISRNHGRSTFFAFVALFQRNAFGVFFSILKSSLHVIANIC